MTAAAEALAAPRGSAVAAADRRGRTTVSGRALRAVAASGVAVELGVPRKDVSVELRDERGRLAVLVRTPVVVDAADGAPNGSSVGASAGATDGVGRDVLTRAEAARARAARDLADLGGAGVGVCCLVVTEIRLQDHRRRELS